jgi:hypothetical protein
MEKIDLPARCSSGGWRIMRKKCMWVILLAGALAAKALARQ